MSASCIKHTCAGIIDLVSAGAGEMIDWPGVRSWLIAADHAAVSRYPRLLVLLGRVRELCRDYL
jgi:hypothetical protein